MSSSTCAELNSAADVQTYGHAIKLQLAQLNCSMLDPVNLANDLGDILSVYNGYVDLDLSRLESMCVGMCKKYSDN